MKTPILHYNTTKVDESENFGVAWNDSFKLGNEQVDHQHRTLFELVSNLVNAGTEGTATEKLQETLDFLVNYTVKHFQDEEALQIKSGYPDFETHRKLHEDFKITVVELVGRFSANASPDELSRDVNRIVVRWLVNHILREDKKIGVYLREIKWK